MDNEQAEYRITPIDKLRGLELWFDRFLGDLKPRGFCDPSGHPHGYSVAEVPDWELRRQRDEIREIIAGHNIENKDEVVSFLDDVKAEVVKARAKYPGRKIRALAMAAESGEVIQAVLKQSSKRVHEECVQTAVTACRLALEGDDSVDEWREQKGLDPLPGKNGEVG